MNELRDKDGLTEAEFLSGYTSDIYPKPSLTADVLVIAQDGDERDLLLIRRGGHPFLGNWALPGGFANRGECIEETAQRELMEETGIQNVPMELVGVYSEPGRDPRGWTVSVAYVAVVEKGSIQAKAGDDAADAAWFRIEKSAGNIILVHEEEVLVVTGDPSFGTEKLAFDHSHIIADAVRKIGGV